MTDEATPGETESGEPETPDAAASTETPSEAPAADAPEGGAPAPAVIEEAAVEETPVAAPAVAMGPAIDARAENRKTRLWLPLLLPIGAIAVVAFYTLNVSRVFLAASEGGPTPAVIIASGITLSILIGASIIAAFPEIRTSSLVVGLSGVMLVVLLGGSLVLGASEPHEEAAEGYVQPAGPAINTLEVNALPDLRFQATRFDVPAGINLVKYIDIGGTHTLLFDENAVPGFKLSVPQGRNEAKVELEEGDYVIYCDIPGHRAAGMEADLVVGPAPAVETPEPGTENPSTTTVVPGSTETTIPAGTDPSDPAAQSSTGGS
jgi:plastocyanin